MLQLCYFESLLQLISIIPTLTLGVTLIVSVSDSLLSASVKSEEQVMLYQNNCTKYYP